jgi:hypothetical protein
MYAKQNKIPKNEELWNKALKEAKQRFRSEMSSYAQIFARKWYKEHGGLWTDKKQEVEKPKTQDNRPKTPLMSFEQYADEDDIEKDVNQKKQNDEKSDKRHYWFKEPFVDVSRPVLDESGTIIGFHPCGSNTRDYQNSMSSYRTSYPRCMPRSKAMKMNAMEREKYLQTNRYLMQSEENTPTDNSEDEEE